MIHGPFTARHCSADYYIYNACSSDIGASNMLQVHHHVQEEVRVVQRRMQPEYGRIKADRHPGYQCFHPPPFKEQLAR